MLDILSHVLPEAFFDVLKTIPLLLVVYALLYYIENRLTNTPALLSRAAQFGPVVGALAGTIPQCGFSAAAAALFSAGYLAPATLVAVFLATSDEAVPVMLAGGASVPQVITLLVVKFAIAVIGGYILRYTVFRSHRPNSDDELEIEMSACDCSAGSPIWSIIWHTLKTAFFLFAVLFALNLVVHLIGEDVLASLLLSNSIFQPLLCAILGLIPSCAMSVLLSELFVGGTISFGALIAAFPPAQALATSYCSRKKKGAIARCLSLLPPLPLPSSAAHWCRSSSAEQNRIWNGLPYREGRFLSKLMQQLERTMRPCHIDFGKIPAGVYK